MVASLEKGDLQYLGFGRNLEGVERKRGREEEREGQNDMCSIYIVF